MRWTHERALLAQGCLRIAGVDEAGRGPLAGPVVAAAVMFPPAWIARPMPAAWRDLNDSKQLTADRREFYFKELSAHPQVAFAVSVVEADVIDVINILQATHRAMRQAIAALKELPDHALVDGWPVPHLGLPQTAVVKGDALSYSIAAASVLAKVTRDRLMHHHDQTWPHYGFASHKGYGTEQHLNAIRAHGPCPIHRRSFSPVRRDLITPDLFG